MNAAHHPNCYQTTGVPDDLPAGLCDCRVLRMLDAPEATDPTPGEVRLSEQEREALDRASSVLGWQHLMKYSGQTGPWMNRTLLAIVRSVLAARTDALRAEVEALRRERDNARRVATMYQRQIKAMQADEHKQEVWRRAEAAEAEVADLRAKVERVEALADEWEPMARVPGRPESWFGVHARLRAALGGEHA